MLGKTSKALGLGISMSLRGGERERHGVREASIDKLTAVK